MMITSKSPVHSILWLIVVLCDLRSLHHAECTVPGHRQYHCICRYHMVLFLFVVMLMNLECRFGAGENYRLRLIGIISKDPCCWFCWHP